MATHAARLAEDRPRVPAPERAGRLDWVDISKGIGILLVVYGHATGGLILARLLPGDGVAAASFYAIYTFHMPLFFFLSGVFVPVRIARDGRGFLTKLPKTIVYPYLLWSIVQVTILHVAARYVNSPREHLAYATVLWAPPSQFWFLYVLGLYHLLATGFARGERGRLALIGLGSVTLILADVVPLPTTFLKPLAHNLLFYALGLACGGHGAALSRTLTQHRRLIGGGGALVCIVTIIVGAAFSVRYDSGAMVPAAIGGSLAVTAFATCLVGRGAALFRMLGQRAMAIFVAHVLFVAGTRIVLAKFLGFQDGALMLPLLVVAGLAGPVALFAVAARMGATDLLGLGAAPRRQAAGG